MKSLLKKLKAERSLSEENYNKLYPTCSRICTLYGLPKIHKPNMPLRSSLSNVNHYSYKLAKFFIPLLTSLTTSRFIISDSFSFVQEHLSSDTDSRNVFMASFDVVSLFTNIPVNETIGIIPNALFSDHQFFHGLDRSGFEKLLSLSVKNCHFIFNCRLYQQVDGVAMGSPLGPLFANIFMSFHEQKWLNSCPSSFSPLLYKRYVDDCLLLFRSLHHVPLSLEYLNRQHANITFTAEIERDGKLPFFDIDISGSESKFATSVYRKPTFTGLFTNFHCFIPNGMKQNLVSCLIHRIFNLCSSYENFHTQLEIVRKLLNLNGFPSHMFDRIVRRFLDHTFDSKPPVLIAPRKIVYFCLPFTGIHSVQILPLQDEVPKYLRSIVVYLFKCRCSAASYVGQTTRHLHTKISEHGHPTLGTQLTLTTSKFFFFL